MNDQEKLDELLEIEEPSYNRNIKKKVDHLIFKKCVGIFTVFCIFTLLIFGASILHEYIKMKNHEKWEQQQQYYNICPIPFHREEQHLKRNNHYNNCSFLLNISDIFSKTGELNSLIFSVVLYY